MDAGYVLMFLIFAVGGAIIHFYVLRAIIVSAITQVLIDLEDNKDAIPVVVTEPPPRYPTR